MTKRSPQPHLVPSTWATLLFDLAVPAVAAFLTVGLFVLVAR